jgi:hypothetical protein
MTAVGKISKPVLRRSIIKEVATAVVAGALGEERSFEVSVDESGARPVADVVIAGGADATTEAVLKNAFRTYEFTTRISFSGR